MTRNECIERIRELRNPRDLLAFWQRIQRGQVDPVWAGGKALEYLILRAFELEGAQVEWPFEVKQSGTTLEQIDGVVYVDGLYCMLEAKDESVPVNYEPIAKLRGQLQRRPGFVIGVVLSRSGFTEPAKTLTRMTIPQSVLLWDGNEIEVALTQNYRAWERRHRRRPHAGGSLNRQAIGVIGMRQALQLKVRMAVERAVPDFNVAEVVLP